MDTSPKIPLNATPEQIQEIVQQHEEYWKRFEQKVERDKRQFAWLDRVTLVIAGILGLILLAQVFYAIYAGGPTWKALEAVDFRLAAAWVASTLIAFRKRIIR